MGIRYTGVIIPKSVHILHLCRLTCSSLTMGRMAPQKEAVISLAATCSEVSLVNSWTHVWSIQVSACNTRLAVGYHSGTVAVISLEAGRDGKLNWAHLSAWLYLSIDSNFRSCRRSKSRSLTVNWKLRRILEPRKRLAQNHAVYCFRLRAAVQRAWIGFSKMWHNMCPLLSASFRSRSLWTRYLRQTLSWLPGGSGLVTVRPRCWRVTRGKWSGVLPCYF